MSQAESPEETLGGTDTDGDASSLEEEIAELKSCNDVLEA